MNTGIERQRWMERRGYLFPSHYATLTRGRMGYMDVGRGEVVLLLHGVPARSFGWRHLIHELSKKFRVIAPDMLGYGLSERRVDNPCTVASHAACLSEFVRMLGLRRPAMVAHDVGGPIGLPLATAGNVSRLVLLNPELPAASDELPSLPGMILWGTRDRTRGPAHLAGWRQLLPEAAVIELEEAGHSPHEDEPAAVSDAVTAFLEVTTSSWRHRARMRRTEFAYA